MKATELSPGWALQQPDPIAALQQVCNNVAALAARQLLKARTAAKAIAPTAILFAQAVLCVSLCFAIMFLCAIIGG